MSDLRDAAELALTALENTCPNTWTSVKENLRKALAQPEHVHAIDISQERVDETAKRKHDCNKCENRGRVLGDSQESYCENCIYGSPWKKDYYKEKNA